MKRRISTGLMLGVALCVVLGGIVWATAVSVPVVSDTTTRVYYWGTDGSTYPVEPAPGLPAGWNSDPGFDETGWGLGALYQHSAYLDPTVPPFASGAKWISYAGNGQGPDYSTVGPRGVYLYRTKFQVPATAYAISGQAAIAADNYGWLYLNGHMVLEPGDKSQNDRNFCDDPCPVGGTGAGASTGCIAPSMLACDNVLAAEVQNGISIGGNGPTGVVFSLDLNYEVPKVAWQPPLTNADFALKDGTTVPLKFKLQMQDGTLITDMQVVYMRVHEGPHDEMPVEWIAKWTLGEGVDSLRFDPCEWYYIGNFQTKNFDLDSGEWYTAVVLDGCGGRVLGFYDFMVNEAAGTARGNSGK